MSHDPTPEQEADILAMCATTRDPEAEARLCRERVKFWNSHGGLPAVALGKVHTVTLSTGDRITVRTDGTTVWLGVGAELRQLEPKDVTRLIGALARTPAARAGRRGE
jgi:hypothetical protein